MVSVAGRQKVARVYGDRVWKGRSLSQPEPFLSIPLVYERSYGGSYRVQPDGPLWTFWDYERDRWAADKGMRLDHLLLSPDMNQQLVKGGVDRAVRGEESRFVEMERSA